MFSSFFLNVLQGYLVHMIIRHLRHFNHLDVNIVNLDAMGILEIYTPVMIQTLKQTPDNRPSRENCSEKQTDNLRLLIHGRVG